MRPLLVAVGAAVAVLLAVGVGLSVGSVAVAPEAVWTLLLERVTGRPPSDATATVVVWELRLPRVLLAFAVGGGLALAGVAMQALVRNPLAEPYVLGVASGASAGASLFYLGFLPPVLGSVLTVPLASFAGALGAVVLVYLLAQGPAALSPTRLLLSGVALSSFLGALSTFVTFASPSADKLRTVLFLLLGSLGGASWAVVPLTAGTALLGLAALWLLARPLDALLLGEDDAHRLGLPVALLQQFLLAITALLTGVLVAAAGVIGFVGLLVPHAVRFVTGVAHRRVVPAAFLTGGVFLVLADAAARSLLPGQELPVGILTAFCGVPVFLLLLRRAAV